MTTTAFELQKFTLTRVIEAPAQRLWNLWTKPELLKTWWGPHRFTNVRATIEPVVGGKVDIVMRGFGKDYPMTGTVETAEAPICLVFNTVAEDGDGNQVLSARTTVVFEDREGGSEISVHEEITPLTEQGAMMAGMGQLGMEQSLERMTGLALSNDLELVVTRLIDAPVEKVREAWLSPELLTQWFAPGDMTTPIADLDPRPGGRFNVTMRNPEGNDYPNEGIFLEVSPNRVVGTDAYREGWIPSEQPFMTNIITFEEVAGKTLYTARVRHWRSEDREKHEQMGFFEGWNAATDQLSDLVSR